MNLLISLHGYTMAAIMMAISYHSNLIQAETLERWFSSIFDSLSYSWNILDWEVASYSFSPTFSSAFLHLCHTTLINLEIFIQLRNAGHKILF